MQFQFSNPNLEALYTKGASEKSKFSPDTVRQFMRVMQIIRCARDARDLRAFSGRRFEDLERDTEGSYSMRLNDQSRLVFTIRDGILLI